MMAKTYTASMRKKIIAGNWKMNATLEEGRKLVSESMYGIEAEVRPDVQIVFVPPYIYLTELMRFIGAFNRIFIGAQNAHQEERGAYTGEISAGMLASCGVSHVLIGHSERRSHAGETDPLLHKKIKQVIANRMIPIYCCGETLEARQAGKQNETVKRQVEQALFDLTEEDIKQVVIAYEPVWAIGSGKVASATQAQEMHAFIRSLIAQTYASASESISILYGGSLKPDNAKELFANKDVDGGLIGGASLKAKDFVAIAKAI